MKLRLSSLLLLLPLAACSRGGEIEDGGIYTYRSACPQVAIPAGTGDITLFSPAGSTDASALDVTAAITNLRATCSETATDVISTATLSEEPLIRGHASWALGRIGTAEAVKALRGREGVEEDGWVREELAGALAAAASSTTERNAPAARPGPSFGSDTTGDQTV